ncbi:MAG: hypothetical protein WC421_02065 [Elusimicrobiales bacterium]
MKFLFMALLAASAAQAAIPPQWRVYQPVQVKAAKPSRVKLSFALQDSAAPDLSDLRIFDQAGAEQPYLLVIPQQQQPRRERPSRTDITAERGRTLITLETGRTDALSGVLLETSAAEFLKSADAAYSTDGSSWQRIARARPVFRTADGRENLLIDLPRGFYPHLQITLDDSRSVPAEFSGAGLVLWEPEPPGIETIPATDFKISLSRNRKDYQITLPAANLYAQDIVLFSRDRVFSRNVAVSAAAEEPDGRARITGLGTATAYRMFIQGHPMVERAAIPVRRRLTHAKTLTVSVTEPAGHSFTLSRIETRIAPVYAEFLPPGPGMYFLCAGNPSARKQGYQLDFSGAKLAALPSRPAEQNPDYSPAAQAPRQPAARRDDISKWRHRALLKPSAKGPQYLELPPEILSRAQPSLADLRIVSGQANTAYAVDDAEISRKIIPRIFPQPPGGQSSAWKLVFSRPALPLTEISCALPDELFSHRAQAYEYDGADRRMLGEAVWSRTPGQTERRYILAIRRPQTDAVWLEIDNGGQAALPVSEFAAYYSTRRIHFATAQAAETYIYYGNPGAEPPGGGIALSTEAARTQVFASGEETRGPSGWSGAGSSAAPKTGKAVFWIVLVSALAALTAVQAVRVSARRKRRHRARSRKII